MLNFIGPNIGVCVGVVTCEQALNMMPVMGVAFAQITVEISSMFIHQ